MKSTVPRTNVLTSSNTQSNASRLVRNDPNELDLLDVRKPSSITSIARSDHFPQILPCIRRLVTLFDFICPNIYRMNGSDSLRILKEITCLTDEYLRVYPSLAISLDELLYSERHFDDYMTKLRLTSTHRRKHTPSINTELHCFGQGIHTCDYYNELHRTLVFCFELSNISSPTEDPSSFLQAQVVDPNGDLVPSEVQCINTYNQGATKLFSCSYTPTSRAGTHKISFLYHNTPILHYPYTVYIRESASKSHSPRQREQRLSAEVLKKKQQGKRILFSAAPSCLIEISCMKYFSFVE